LKERLHRPFDLPHGRYSTNYGFHRWDSLVENKCTIHIPWYAKEEWNNLYLKVDPIDRGYGIQINGRSFDYAVMPQGHLVVKLSGLKGVNREIFIESLDHGTWKFLELSLDFS
jgi:hypothetical protein